MEASYKIIEDPAMTKKNPSANKDFSINIIMTSVPFQEVQ